MQAFIDPNLLNHLWDNLQEKPKDINPYRAEKLFVEINARGFASFADIEDIFYLIEPRLDKREMPLRQLCEYFEINIDTVYYKPKSKSNSVVGFDAISAVGVAKLLMTLERCGFETDASLLVEKILPILKGRDKRMLTAAELDVFWFKKIRHKNHELTMIIQNWTTIPYAEKRFKTRQGYKVWAKVDEAGNAIFLNISAPKYRIKKEPYQVTCKICGYQWYKGDPDSSAAHREEHKERMTYFDPQPHPAMLAERASGGDYELVVSSSPLWKHKEMYLRARAFKREFGYDFIQWKSPKGDDDPLVHGYLFTDAEGAIIGACAFRNRTNDPQNPSWGLQWAWICPRERRKGHLTLRWPAFRARFGDFTAEPPLSDEMQQFLDKETANIQS